MAQQTTTAGLTPGRAEIARIQRALRGWESRRRLALSVRWLPRGLAAGSVLALIVALVGRVTPLLTRLQLAELAALLAAVGMAIALAIVWLGPRHPLALARRFDALFGLKERLSTALELAGGALPPVSPALTGAQRKDAAAVLDGVDARRGLPIRIDWRDWILPVIALGLLTAAILVPNPQDAVLAEQAAVEEAIVEQLRELESLRREALEDADLDEDLAAEVVEQLDEAIETLSQDDISQQEALAALTETEQALREFAEQSEAQRQQALDAMAGALEQAGGDAAAEALEAGEVQQITESLGEMLGDMSAEQQAALAEQLADMAEDLAGSDAVLAESLSEAAEALQAGNLTAAESALQDSAEAMTGEGESAQAELSDLADQLRQAQGDVAQAQGMRESALGGQPADGNGGKLGGGVGAGQSDMVDSGQLAGDRVQQSSALADGGEDDPEIYSPFRIGEGGDEDIQLPGVPEAGVPIAEGEMVDNPTGEVTVPYSEVYGDYAETVNEALESGYVPLGMRGLIQQYFTRLDPEDQ